MSPPQNEATYPRCCDERVVGHHTEVFVGIDTSKSRNAIAIADGGRCGEVRYLGEFPATEAAIRKLVAKLAAKCCHLTFCYEAGPTGFSEGMTQIAHQLARRGCRGPAGDAGFTSGTTGLLVARARQRQCSTTRATARASIPRRIWPAKVSWLASAGQ